MIILPERFLHREGKNVSETPAFCPPKLSAFSPLFSIPWYAYDVFQNSPTAHKLMDSNFSHENYCDEGVMQAGT